MMLPMAVVWWVGLVAWFVVTVSVASKLCL